MSKVIVQPLIEALSELVSQVGLIIVQNKAANKPPPQELPMCVMGIQKAAGNLVNVAKTLAGDEYEDFPMIQEEIMAGASDVEASAKQLNEATVVLAKGTVEDRPGAWDSLGEAVRIMAQNTAILLHIVYGAEIKKIFALSNYAEGKLADLLRGIDGSGIHLYEKNPQLFVNKVQACMEDVQKLAQGVQQKATEEESPYAKKELELVASTLLAHVEPFVAHANELLADPANDASRKATIKDLKDMIDAAALVGAPKKARPAMQELIPQLMDCATNIMDIESATPEGQKEAAKLQSTLNDISRAVKVADMGPHTGMMNQIVELHKDLDMIESALENPASKPLGAVDPFDVSDPHTQGLLNVVRKMQPDDNGGKDQLLADVEKFAATMTNDLLPCAANARKTQNAAELAKAKQAIANARANLDEIVGDMGLSAEQKGQVKTAAKVNACCIKLSAMAGSKAQNKQDLFSAAKDLTELMGEMSALLGLAGSSEPSDGARGALASQMEISGALSTPTVPKPTPKPGSAKAMMKKVAPAATQYKSPVSAVAAPLSRDSVQGGFLSVGAGAEELRTLSLPASTKGRDLMSESDPIITGVHSLGEQLAALSKAATSGDNAGLLAAGKAIHEKMKAYSAELRKRAQACKDPRIQHELITLSNQLKNWSVQLKILSSVKASSGGGRDSDKALISMAQLISNGLRSAPAKVVAGLLA